MHHREYVQATGINLLYTFCVFLYYPILAPFVKSIGLDDFQLGLVFAIFPLMMIFSSPIIGRLADNIGKTKVIIIGAIIEIVAIALYLIETYWWVIIIARILNAIAFSSVILIAIAKIEDSLTNKERGKYAGWSFSLAHIGAIVAPVIGGLMADHLFVKAPFILTAVLLLVMAFILASRTPKSIKKIEKSNFNLLAAVKTFLSINSLKGMAALGVVMHASTPALEVFLPLYIIEKLGLSYTYIGVALFFVGITKLFQFYFGSLNETYGRKKMILIGCGIFAFFLLLLAVAHTYWVLLLFLFFLGLGASIWNISAWTLMSDVGVKLKKTGEVIGSYMSISKVGSLVSFIFSGLIVQVLGFEALFIINAILIVVGMFIAAHYFGKPDHVPTK